MSYAVQQILAYAKRGQLAPGGRLPSERMLATELNISRSTLRAALQELELRGLVSGRPQSGWYVMAKKLVGDSSTELESFTSIAAQRGFTATAVVLRCEERAATLSESDRLGIPPASPVMDLQRIRLLDDVPTCVDTSIIPMKIAAALRGVDFTQASLLERLRTLCGVDAWRTVCILRAVPAHEALAQHLKLSLGDAVLELDSLGFDPLGAPILISLVEYRGDAYRFVAELTRAEPFPSAQR